MDHPHAFIYLAVKDENGKEVEWAVENDEPESSAFVRLDAHHCKTRRRDYLHGRAGEGRAIGHDRFLDQAAGRPDDQILTVAAEWWRTWRATTTPVSCQNRSFRAN